MKRARLIAAALIAVAGLAAGAATFVAGTVRELALTLPPVADAAVLPVSAAVVDRNGELLRPFTTRDGLWRLPVELGEVDTHFIEMLLAYEDRHFRGHD